MITSWQEREVNEGPFDCADVAEVQQCHVVCHGAGAIVGVTVHVSKNLSAYLESLHHSKADGLRGHACIQIYKHKSVAASNMFCQYFCISLSLAGICTGVYLS